MMRTYCPILVMGAALALFCAGASAQPWDVYKPNVPDVDKANPFIDLTCAMAGGANQLGAGGFNGGNAQGIYDAMVDTFGNKPAMCLVASKWWLGHYGHNPDSPLFAPNVRYTDYHVHSRAGHSAIGPETGDWPAGGAGLQQYDHLLEELQACQYVNVGWYGPDGPGHCMSLVGGDWSWRAGGTSAWHDSNRDQNPPSPDDSYANTFEPTWRIPQPDFVDKDGHMNWMNWSANYAVVLCPGLQKPVDAMRNYDVAYFPEYIDPVTFSVVPVLRPAGRMKDQYQRPEWQSDTVIRIYNEEREPGWSKDIYLLVDFAGTLSVAPDIRIRDDRGNLATLAGPLGGPEWSSSHGQALYHFRFPEYQPQYEEIIFPSIDYRTLEGSIVEWDVSTICIPEPATLMLLALAGLALLRRRHT